MRLAFVPAFLVIGLLCWNPLRSADSPAEKKVQEQGKPSWPDEGRAKSAEAPGVSLVCAIHADNPPLDPYCDRLTEGAVSRIGSLRNSRDQLRNVAITPDGSRFVADLYYRLVVRDTRSFAEVRTIRLPESGYSWGAAISDDGRRVAAVVGLPAKDGQGPRRKSAFVWDVATGERLCEIELATDPYELRLRALTLTFNGKRLATMGRLIDVDTRKIVREIPFDENADQLEFVAGDRYLVALGAKGWSCWETATGKEVRLPANRPEVSVGRRHLARGGQSQCFVEAGDLVRMTVEWPTPDRTTVKFGPPERFPVRDALEVVRMAEDGKRALVRAASGDDGPALWLFDFETKKVVDRLTEDREYHHLHAAALTEKGALLLVRPSHLHMPKVDFAAIELPGGKNLTLERGLRFIDGELHWTPDGKRLRDDKQLWDARTGKHLGPPRPEDRPPERWRPSPRPDDSGSEIAFPEITAPRIAFSEGNLALVQTWKQVPIGGPMFRFEPDQPQVWDVSKKRKLHDLQVPGREPLGRWNERGLSRDGGAFVLAAGDTFFVWDTLAGRPVARETIDAGSSAALRGEPVMGRTGRELLVAPRGRLLLYDIASRTLALNLKLDLPPDQMARAFDWSPDGRLAAVIDPNDELLVYDLYRVERVWKVATNQKSVHAVQFSPDGRSILTQDKLGGLVWSVPEVKPFFQPLKEEEFAAAWDRLLSPSAAECREALFRLAASGEAAAQFLGGKLEAEPGPDPEKLDTAIARLQSGDFRKRTTAEKELRELDEVALPRLKKLLDTETTDADLTERLNRLIEAAKGMAPPHSTETLRKLRAITALEAIRTTAARRALERLANGAEGSAVTREARAALEQMK